ncbi:histone lysine methyltransferaseSet7 (predicted) [Planoprotostelium fungivorum]|uniref:Histone lysine methyltransferaseSet7 (Predicted) n=1 Tax=Planoprotostelium fungivorum TaxID=1890364 RepID=A0A2P6NDN4_9EUKA|nr:histone lysine methyltransferaseSet7 (predicted) [Planoprotostelium fungivorum]
MSTDGRELWTVTLTSYSIPLEIRNTVDRGRGVFTTAAIPARTLIEQSPILFFPQEEYVFHGKYTQLDHYTYIWEGGYALALGLGSMFNHNKEPNVGYMRDKEKGFIVYTTLREIAVGEELTIHYGIVLFR